MGWVVSQLLSAQPNLVSQVSSPVETLRGWAPQRERHLFILDGCLLYDQLTQLSRLLRVRCPGSKFLVFLPPERGQTEEMLRLLYTGVDGIVTVAGAWQEEIPRAVQAILEGNLWVPPQVMAEYARQAKLLLDKQLRPDLPLTGREHQILELMIRRLSNKEIAEVVGISERTAKFHVSNIFRKLSVRSRQGLLAVMNVVPQPP